MSNQLLVVINPISGAHGRPDAGRERAELAASLLGRAGRSAEVAVTRGCGDAEAVARAGVARGARLVLAWGGDGTINEVGNALAFSDARLGIVPAGSGNGLALELGISRNPARAIEQALGGADRRLDAGEIDGRLFFNVAGIGMDAVIARIFNERGRTRRGLWTYAAATLRSLAAYRPRRYTIASGPVHVERTALFVAVANGRQYGYRARIAPDASLTDGHLDLVIVEGRSPIVDLLRARRLFDGSILRDRRVTRIRTERAVLSSDADTDVHLDGETRTAGPTVDIRARPAALWVRVPRD
jgi:YegS/Rv2252/BmrU family lipid kinase